MTLHIRPHHLLCILTYIGRGYNSAFITNFNGIVSRIGAGEKFLLIEGPDDICSPLLSEQGTHCLNNSVKERDEKALTAIKALLAAPMDINSYFSLTSDHVIALRHAFAFSKNNDNSIRKACIGCQWNPLCTTIAAEGYLETLLYCPDK